MTNYNKTYAYLAAALAIILPVPGRIAFGLFVIVHFNLLVIFTTLISKAISALKLETVRIGIVAMALIAFTIFYKLLMAIICPVAALTLGFSIYMPSISSVILTLLVARNSSSLKENLSEKCKTALIISGYSLIIFVIRDIFGFGTITLPYWKNLFVLEIPVLFEKVSAASFLATIPGCLLLAALTLFIHLKLMEKKDA